MKVKYVDDLNENWHVNISAEHPHVCKIWRSRLFAVCIIAAESKPPEASIHA